MFPVLPSLALVMALSLPVFLVVCGWGGAGRGLGGKPRAAADRGDAFRRSRRVFALVYRYDGPCRYTGPVDPFAIEQIQEGSILRAIFLSGTMGVLFLVRGLILLRRKAAAEQR